MRDQATPDLGVSAEAFWAGVEGLLAQFSRRNRDLLERRDKLQRSWTTAPRLSGPAGSGGHQADLQEIGYIEIEREGVRRDGECRSRDRDHGRAATPGSTGRAADQRPPSALTRPMRRGSLYDGALYGTDALGEALTAGGYDVNAGARVIARARAVLDQAMLLATGSHVLRLRPIGSSMAV